MTNTPRRYELKTYLGTEEFEVLRNKNGRYDIEVVSNGNLYQERNLWYSEAKKCLMMWGLSFTEIGDLLQ